MRGTQQDAVIPPIAKFKNICKPILKISGGRDLSVLNGCLQTVRIGKSSDGVGDQCVVLKRGEVVAISTSSGIEREELLKLVSADVHDARLIKRVVTITLPSHLFTV